MSSENKSADSSTMPWYQDVDGFRIPGMFSREAYLSALSYKPRPDDLFIVTYPKCGTTWVQNIIGGIYRGGKPYDSALEFFTQTPFLELTGAEGAEKMKRPGAIKLHLPFYLTPYSPDAKYIFVTRNPKDTCVSFYHHTKNLPGYKYVDGKFDDYFELFIEGKTDFGDYFDTLLSWYEHKDDPNVLFLTYEELKQDTEKHVLRLAEFMGPQYKEAMETDPEMLYNVIKHSSFNYMKEIMNKHLAELGSMPQEWIQNNPDIPQGLKKALTVDPNNPIFSTDSSQVQFVRKGIVGDWRNHFSEEQCARLEARFREKTNGTDIANWWKDCM